MAGGEGGGGKRDGRGTTGDRYLLSLHPPPKMLHLCEMRSRFRRLPPIVASPRFTHMLTLITTGLSFQAGFRAPAATSAARSMATMDATALKQARTSPLPDCRIVFPVFQR